MNSCISPAAYEAIISKLPLIPVLRLCIIRPQIVFFRHLAVRLHRGGVFILKPVIPILAGSFHLCTLTFSYDLYSVLPQFVRWRIAGRNAYDI